MRLRLTVTAAVATTLASIGLYPLFETPGWFGTGFGAVLLVAVVGLLTRRWSLPAAVCPLIALAALLLYLTVMFAAGDALLGIVPTPESVVTLGRMFGDGWHDANAYAAPVPVLPPIDMLSATGIGLVAILVDLLAVRVRRAALAGLPLLAMYCVPAAVRQETVSWLAFVLGAAGYLGLLVADSREQLYAWGRPVFTRRWAASQEMDERPDAGALAATGRRIGLTAMAVAIVVPLAVPGIEPRGIFGLGGSGSDGKGHGSTGLTGLDPLDPLVSIRRQLVFTSDAEVLDYTTSDGAAPDYLRMYSLDRFDGENWTTGNLRGGKDARVAGKRLPTAPGLVSVPVRAVSTRIGISKKVRDLDVLPTPYPPTKVDIKGDWRYDQSSLSVFSPHDSAGGRTYTVSSVRPEPDYQQLETTASAPSTITGRYLAVPGWLNNDFAELASTITGNASTNYDKAVKLQEWFTKPGNFTYSLSTPPPRIGGGGSLRDFLFHSKTGYCEQFASSMALLARLLGIPARVGMGYTAGTRQPDGTWVVRTKDAHAWPELYFTGIGWLRFEPTPAGGEGQGSALTPDYTTPRLVPGSPSSDPQIGSTTTSNPLTGDAAGSRYTSHHRTDLPSDITGAAGPVAKPAGDRTPLAWLLAALAVLVLLLVPAALRRVSRVYRWTRAKSDTDVAHAAWDELRATTIDHGLPWRASDSPRATAHHLANVLTLDEAPAEALTRIARAEERALYAREPARATTLRADMRVINTALRGKVPGRTRWRARLLPPSSAMLLRQAGSKLLDAFDWLDVATIRRRHRT